MKTSINFSAFLLAASLVLNACGGDKKTTAVTDSDTAITNTPVSEAPAVLSPDQETVNLAVTKNTKELVWLYAGIDKSSNKELKEHARMMLTDHKKLEADVKGLAAKKSWALPAVDTANVVDINDKTGKDWDKAWTDKMVDEHSGLLADLQKAQASVTDEELRTLITKTIPVVQSHLDMVKHMQSKMK